jgi:hypothetical protein
MLASCLAGLAAPAWGETPLTPHKAEYKVSVSVFGGQLNTELHTTPDGYVATHAIKTTGMSRLLASGNIVESASFARQSGNFRPQSYHSNDTLTRDKIRADIEFDWDAGEASGTVNGEAFSTAVDAITYDRVSIQYELMSDLMNGVAADQYMLFDIDEIKDITVRNIGSRTVSVPAGKFEAIGVQHQTPGSKRVTTMWCVKELDYLPVIVEPHRNGKLRMRAELRSYSPLKT